MARNDDDDDLRGERPLSLRELAASALWALFGVQKDANRQRDFARGRPGQFVLLLIGLVKLALGLASA